MPGLSSLCKIIVAIDAFKGCLSSAEANRAAADALRKLHPDAEIIEMAVSDGGEGFLEAYHQATDSKGEVVEISVKDPMNRPCTARYLMIDKTAVIEIAQAVGLTLVKEEERNPMRATSYGVGMIIADAVKRGVQHIVVGLGGSATSDAGIGMLRSLIDIFAKNKSWDDIEELRNVSFTIATDVRNPLCGINGAAHVFARQKGADDEMIAKLDDRARRFAHISALHFGRDCSENEGAGAAGGLGYAFMQYMNADCKKGIDMLLEAANYAETVRDADLVITGEGQADCQTLMGKLPCGILNHSKGAEVVLIAGRVSDREDLLKAGFSQIVEVSPRSIPLSEAMQKEVARHNIAKAMEAIDWDRGS